MGLSHTVSGNIASFRTPSKVPIESLKFHFLPKQAAGTPSPENPIPITGWTGLNGKRAGKNLYSYSESNIARGEVRTGSSTYVYRTIYHTGIPSGSYVITASIKDGETRPAADPAYVMFNAGYCKDGICVANGWFIMTDSERAFSLTVPSGAELVIIETSDSEWNMKRWLTAYNIQIETGNVGSSIEPYEGENIPIIFPVAGKNKFNPNTEWTIGSPYRYVPFYYGEHDFYMSFTVKDQSIDTSDLYIGFSYFEPISSQAATAGYTWCIEKGVIKQNHTNRISQGVPSDHYGMIGRYLFVYPNTDDAYNRLISKYNIQIEEGTSATAFEPYSSDNTFYGGYYDPVAGEIVAEYGKHVYDGTTMRVSMNYKISGKFYGIKAVSDCQFGSSGRVISNILKTQTNHGENTCTQLPSDPGYLMDFALSTFCDLSTEAYDVLTIQEQVNLVNDYLAELYENETPLVIVYKLSSPVHISLPAEDMKAFLDHNNFWSDANDITEVTYAVTESKDMLATRKLAMDFDMGHHKKVQWNQLVKDGNFTSGDHWLISANDYGTVSVNDNIAVWTSTNPELQHFYRTGFTNKQFYLNIPENHRVLVKATVRSSVSRTDSTHRVSIFGMINYENSYSYTQNDVQANTWTDLFGFIRDNRTEGKKITRFKVCYGGTVNDGTIPVGTVLEVKNFMAFDLTQMFGLGNEPSTVEEFEHICEINGIDLTTYQPYDQGSDRWLIIP